MLFSLYTRTMKAGDVFQITFHAMKDISLILFEFTHEDLNRLIPENIGMLLEVPMENVGKCSIQMTN